MSGAARTIRARIAEARARARREARSWSQSPHRRLALRGRLQEPYWRRRFLHFGSGAILYKPVWLAGTHKISIGDGAALMMCWLSVEPQAWGEPGAVLSIGKRVALRPYSTIGAAESVVIEDDVGIAAHSLVTDSDHLTRGRASWLSERYAERDASPEPNRIVITPPQATPVRIGRGTWVGERVAVLRGSSIGRFCVIATNSVVRGEIPDYSVAAGAPARVVGSTR